MLYVAFVVNKLHHCCD